MANNETPGEDPRETDPLVGTNRPRPQPHARVVDANRDGIPDSLIEQFCDSLDIIVPRDGEAGVKPEKDGHYEEILWSITKHRLICFGLNSLAVVLFVSQLLVGIAVSTITSLYGEKARTAIIILGAVETLVGGLAGGMQYWGEPARENRYYDSLQRIEKKVKRLMVKFKNPDTQLEPYDEGEKIWETFEQAHADAWSNNPIIWLQGTRAPNGVGDRVPRGDEEDDDDV